MTESASSRPGSAYDRRQGKGLGWQDHGPVLRNWGQRAPIDPRFLDPLEALIWIATRDEDAIKGAKGFVAGDEDGAVPPNPRFLAQIAIEQRLVGDVAGHHLDCSRSAPLPVAKDGAVQGPPRGVCNCAELGRLRYCHCPDRLRSDIWTCSCVKRSQKSFLDAIHGGMQLYGRRKGEEEYIDVPRAALAGLAIQYDENGLTLLPSFERLRIPIDEVKRRWPPNFAELGLEMPTARRKTPGAVVASRPTKADAYLTMFRDRLASGQTKPSKPKEVLAIQAALKTPTNNPKPDTIDKAIRDFWPLIEWGDDLKPTNAIDVIPKIDAAICA